MGGGQVDGIELGQDFERRTKRVRVEKEGSATLSVFEKGRKCLTGCGGCACVCAGVCV